MNTIIAGTIEEIFLAKIWHSNIFCTPIFVLGQDESQGSIAEIADGQKSGSTLHF